MVIPIILSLLRHPLARVLFNVDLSTLLISLFVSIDEAKSDVWKGIQKFLDN